MKIQILSDQHLEFEKNQNYFVNNCHSRADTLIIAGDFCNHNSPIRYNYINNHVLPKWKNTIMIPGNHEFYGSHVNDEWFGVKDKIYDGGKGSKVHYLNNGVVEIDGFYFVCSTLWSWAGYDNASQVQHMMNDYREISGLTVDRLNEYHKINRDFLQDAMMSIPNGKRCVMITHHVPSFNLIGARWRGNNLNEAFSADMDTFIMMYGDKISHWIHGHSHDFLDRTLSGIRFIRNPMGYPGERDCDMDLVIEI
jgi:Icc-related predicted phosphoesterase